MPADALALQGSDDPLATTDPMERSLVQSFQEGQRETAASQKQKHELLDPQIQELRRDIDTRSRIGSRVPKDKETPEPPNPQLMMQEAGTWVAAATVMGALAGALTRRSTTNALAAFTGALEGMQQGNQQKFQQNYKFWEAESKKIEADNRAAMEKYDAVLKNKNLDITQKASVIGMQAQQLQDDVVVQASSRKEYTTLLGLLDQRRRQNEQMANSAEYLRQYQAMNQARMGTTPEQIESIAKYETQMAPRGSPQRQAQLTGVNSYLKDQGLPAYDEPKYLRKQRAEAAYGSGPDATKMVATNTAIDHLSTMVDLGKAMQNKDIPAVNALKNAIAQNFGQPWRNDFEYARDVVAKEVSAVLVSGAGTGEERAALGKRLDSASSMPQLLGVVQTAHALMRDRLVNAKAQFVSSKGSPQEFDQMLSQKARELLYTKPALPGQAGPASSPTGSSPTPEAIQHLKANPGLRDFFDQKYGPGSAAKVLGGGNGA